VQTAAAPAPLLSDEVLLGFVISAVNNVYIKLGKGIASFTEPLRALLDEYVADWVTPAKEPLNDLHATHLHASGRERLLKWIKLFMSENRHHFDRENGIVSILYARIRFPSAEGAVVDACCVLWGSTMAHITKAPKEVQDTLYAHLLRAVYDEVHSYVHKPLARQ
jgi:hypothetical protein